MVAILSTIAANLRTVTARDDSRLITRNILLIIPLGMLIGCACVNPVEIPLPSRPDLQPVTQELWDTVPKEAQEIWTANDLALKKYITKLEARIKINN